MENEEYRTLKPTRRSPLAVVSNAAMTFEREVVRCQVRLTHLKKRGRTCPYTERLLARVQPIKESTVEMLAELIEGHPAYWWFSHIKGIGRENISKLCGEIENFGRYYEIGDPRIPSEVQREPEEYVYLDEEQNTVASIGIWVAGIERLTLPSKQRVFLGHAPGIKRKRGEKHSYSSRGKMLLWRVGTSLIRVPDGSYANEYHAYKDYLTERELAKGTKIIPTLKERYCPACEKEVVKKAARYCPDCHGPLSMKEEPPGVLYKGHLDLMARRRMQQLFSDHLNVVWRRSLGLSVRETPYAVEYKGHSTIIYPEDMMDKKCGVKGCPVCQKYGLKQGSHKTKVNHDYRASHGGRVNHTVRASHC